MNINLFMNRTKQERPLWQSTDH